MSDVEAQPLVDAVMCEGLVVIYETGSMKVHALRGLDLRIPQRSSVAISGPSGSGKSTLLRVMAGLATPNAGRVLIQGVDLSRISRLRRRRTRTSLITHVEQRPSDNLLPHLTALEHMRRVALRRNRPASAADDALAALGLSSRQNHRPHEMSGGEQQRLAFALGSVGGGPLIVADEPTAELDSSSAGDVLNAIDILVETGTTVLVATHDERVIERLTLLVELREGAIASVTGADGRLATIDSSGRLQLPPAVLAAFPDRRARLTWHEERQALEVKRP